MSIKMKYGVLLGLALICLSGVAIAQPVDGADVWYTYTPTAANDYVLSLEAFSGATVAVFDGDDVVSDPGTAAPFVHELYSSELTLALDADVPYYFRVAGEDQGGGDFATGAYTIVLDEVGGVEGEPVEGEGEPLEGEGEPVEGEGEPNIDDILDNFDDLDANGDGVLDAEELASQLTNDQFAALDANSDGVLDVCELGGTVTITVDSPVAVACEDFDQAHQDIADAFKSVTANCADKVVTVADIAALDSKGEVVEYNLDEIAAKIPEFGAYDNSIDKTRELFHKYFLFQGGEFTLTYTVDGVTEEQVITIGKECRGCLGCYSCDSCAGRRPIPDNVMDLKRLMSDWLLIGLSIMTLMSLSALKKD